MIWTAWNNGAWHASGGGYGFKVDLRDRNRWFSRAWRTVSIELPSGDRHLSTTVNTGKASFWGAECRELISRGIGGWLVSQGHAHWPKGMPPRFEVRTSGTARFVVVRQHP